MNELASQHFKVNDSGQKQSQNLLTDSSNPELQRVNFRLKTEKKDQIKELAETGKFYSQASVLREIVRLGLPELLREVQHNE